MHDANTDITRVEGSLRQSMAATIRLRNSAEIRAVFDTGAVAHGRALVLHGRRRAAGGPARWAVVASRKVGGAVARNRAKRRLRAVVTGSALPEGIDLVVVARADAAGVAYSALRAEFEQLLARVASTGKAVA